MHIEKSGIHFMIGRALALATTALVLCACGTQTPLEDRSTSASDRRLGGAVGVNVGSGPAYFQRTQAMDAQRQRRDQWDRANP